MRKLLLFMLAAFAFAACEQAPIEELSVVRADAPETLTVSLEGDDTRIQLNTAQKTVWTKGDQVSVFYRSNANQKWQYQGETGERTAVLKRVDAGNATETMKRVVVVYPYNKNYYINTETYNVQASLPAVQHYLKDSYGLDGNIMISSAEYNDVTLKNVCGWLKLQLTGNGEVVKSIKFRGNNGEQVAGELYINSADATAILASDMGNIAEDEGENATGGAGANLSFDDVVLKEVTLDCGEGVELGAEVTTFYIALPPQTFEKGFTVDVECEGYKPMVISTENALTIERNFIQPMASKEHNAALFVPYNQIWYTSSDGKVVTPHKTNAFGATIVSNTYNRGKGIITFDGDVTTIGRSAFYDCDSLTSVTIPNSVTTIEHSAFSSCSSLTSVIIPDSVTTIEEGTFYSCNNLTSVTIPNSVTTIGENAFVYCYRLTSVTIPNSVTTIGVDAFFSCSSLTSVIIPDSVTTIGDGAFSACDNIAEFKGKFAEDNGRILVVDGVLKAFAPAGISEYTIPDSVTEIGGYVFFSCESLTSVTIPDSVTTIGVDAFGWCRSLTGITIPDSVTTIGERAFRDCGSLTSVTIPDSVTTIGSSAFDGCRSLKSVTIPDSVTTIGERAFYECETLKNVYCKATTPPALGYDAFYYNSSDRKIYVPAESIDAYKSANRWNDYASDIVGYNF